MMDMTRKGATTKTSHAEHACHAQHGDLSSGCIDEELIAQPDVTYSIRTKLILDGLYFAWPNGTGCAGSTDAAALKAFACCNGLVTHIRLQYKSDMMVCIPKDTLAQTAHTYACTSTLTWVHLQVTDGI